jgi:hypothetical protein
MMKRWIWLSLSGVLAFSCGKEEDKQSAATVSYGPLKASLLDSDTIESYDQTSAACTSDSNSGLFTATFSGEKGSKLDVKIKGFSTQGGTYTCKQSTDNVSGDVGQRYDSCMVEITVPDASSSYNSYAMHRSTESLKDFTYVGACTVSAQYEAPKVTLTVDCTKMIQTVSQGAARNPIAPEVTARVRNTTVVNCNI